MSVKAGRNCSICSRNSYFKVIFEAILEFDFAKPYVIKQILHGRQRYELLTAGLKRHFQTVYFIIGHFLEKNHTVG